MNTNNIWTQYNCATLTEFFDYILEVHSDRKFEQVSRLIGELSNPQKAELIRHCYFGDASFNEKAASFCIEKSLTMLEGTESAPKSKQRHFIVKIEERNGERAYTIPYLYSMSAKVKNVEKHIDAIAKTWYADRDRGARDERGWYSFDSGCVMARIEDYKEVTEAEFLTMQKYI